MPFWPRKESGEYFNQNEPPGVAPRLVRWTGYNIDDMNNWTTRFSYLFFFSAAAAVCGTIATAASIPFAPQYTGVLLAGTTAAAATAVVSFLACWNSGRLFPHNSWFVKNDGPKPG